MDGLNDNRSGRRGGSTVVTVCDTCGFTADEKARDGVTGGAAFAALVEAAAVERPEVSVRRFACLMGCGKPCNAAVSAPGKMGYVLGGFAPTREAAAALVDYAALHSESEAGVVAYRSWPQGVKGRFVSRTPPC